MAEKSVSLETSPKIVSVYHRAKNSRALAGSVWLRNVPGALATAASALAGLGVNLIASSSANINGSEMAEWGFFADIEDDRITREKLTDVLKGLPQVVRFDFEESSDGIVVDAFHYPLKFSSGQQGMLVSRGTFSGMLMNLREVYGSGGNVIAYQLGMSTGRQDARELVASLGADRVIINLPKLLNLYLAQGWGVPTLVDLGLDPLHAVVRINDSFECAGSKSNRPTSHFLRGHLAGMGSELFGKPVEVSEVKCVSTRSEYCEFRAVEV